MKKLKISLSLLVMLCCTNTVYASVDVCSSNGNPTPQICSAAEIERGKVTICHVPAGCPENSHTICVKVSAVDRRNYETNHFPGAHGGDYLGACQPIVTPTPTPTPTATPSFSPTPSPTPEKKVAICHLTGDNNPKAIDLVVDESAVPAHLAHGDQLGACVFDCAGTPFGMAILDECGTCGGDSSTCKDCAGVPNGTSIIDSCGVCAGDGTSCLDCAGVPNGDLRIDLCGVCGGDNSSCKDCNGTPNGEAKIDLCGVCNGQNNTCLDCTGLPNGQSIIDSCGVCGGDGTSCLDCAGVPNGYAKLDLCGVCNGNNSTCVDCRGEPNGQSKLDLCGICGGDNTSCLDCAGIPNGNSKLDSCGVCNGDNACFDCANIPNGGTLIDRCGVCAGQGGKLVTLKIDKKQLRIKVKTIQSEKVLRYFSMAGRCSKKFKTGEVSSKSKQITKNILEKINELKTKVRLCPGECAKSVNTVTIKKINRLLDKLYIEARIAQLGARSACNVNTPPGNGNTGRDIRDVQNDVNTCPNNVCR